MGLFSRKVSLALTPGHCYRISYECRDIGYGPEDGYGEFVYRGLIDDWGKHEFSPVGGGPEIYLFPDEITNVEGEF
jgi:hypothetical protein